MSDIVVINSQGPMASTVVGGFVEKFGFLNIPVRKLGLHQYLTGRFDLKNNYLKDRILLTLKTHDEEVLQGGVSVEDRDSAKARKLVDMSLIEADLNEFLERPNSSVSNLYMDARNLYAKSVIYKKVDYQTGKHIEYTTDVINYDLKELHQAYESQFDNVFFINLTRDFEGWLEALVSQRFAHPSLKVRLLFLLHNATDVFHRYEKQVENAPGLLINFDELFLPNNEKTLKKIQDHLNNKERSFSIEEEVFDLYGKLCDYKTTFSCASIPNQYLTKTTLKVARYFYTHRKSGYLYDAIFLFFYLSSYIIFKLKKEGQ